MQRDNNSEFNTEVSDAHDASPSVEDIIARGAETASESEPGAPDSGSGIEFTEPRKRRTRRRKQAPEPTPEEIQQRQAAEELRAFFSEQGIGAVFTNGLSAFYTACGAQPLTEQEQSMLARVFAQWAQYRLPAGASSYQPDLLLVAALGMTMLPPRMQPIATATAPFWKRFFSRLTAPFRRKPRV